MRRFTVLMTALLFCAAAFTYAQSPQAVIREITGTMEVKLPGSDAWTPANAGDSVELATVLSTGFKSTAVIAVGGSTLTVRPLTQLSLESLMNMDETEIIGIEMRTGRIQADVSAPLGSKTDFTVRTPATTASVRGTAFYIDPENLRVREGTVKYSAVKNSRRSVMVGAGQSSWLDKKTGGAVPPVDASETNRALPSLAGQNAGPAAGKGAKLKTPSMGNLEIDLTLVSE